MNIIVVTSVMLVLTGLRATGADNAGDTSPVVAQVLGKEITASAIGLKHDAQLGLIIPKDEASCSVSTPVAELQARITHEIARDYVTKNNLAATDAEIREIKHFQDNYMAQDRIKRSKELDKLDVQLSTTTLSPKERDDAEKHRATLLRLAERERRREGAKDLTAEELRSVYGPWIETWKFNKAVYAQYGGTVAITKLGPEPVEATRRLLEQYEKAGNLAIFQADLRSAVWSRFTIRPGFTASPKEIDFTPYWKKPASTNVN